jgi:Tfp pilus assembly protein PilO
MSPRELWATVQSWYAAHSTRDRRILLGVAGLAAFSLVYVAIVEPLRHYRRGVAEETAEGRDQLERAARFVAALDSLRAQRDQLRERLEQAKSRLLPGDSGTLGAAALQERTNSIAAAKGITVQSTQMLKEELAEPFHKVGLRLTLSGELKPFVEFVTGLEYGPQQVSIPFLEVSRRGAVPGAKGPRTLSATVEVTGYLLASEKPKGAEGEAAEGEGEAAGGAGDTEAGAEDTEAGGAEGQGPPEGAAQTPPGPPAPPGPQTLPGPPAPAAEGTATPQPAAPAAPGTS